MTTATADCTKWTVAGGTATGWAGLVNVTGFFGGQWLFWANDLQPCSTPAFVYCLEK